MIFSPMSIKGKLSCRLQGVQVAPEAAHPGFRAARSSRAGSGANSQRVEAAI
jgi:hypothetical protein